MTLEDKIGSTLKHLQENIQAGACIGHYSKKSKDCRECAIGPLCKTRTEEEKTEKTENPVEKPKPKKKAAMKSSARHERIKTLLEINGATLVNEKSSEAAYCFDFETGDKKFRVIYANETGRVQVLVSKEKKQVFEAEIQPETIVRKVLAFVSE